MTTLKTISGVGFILLFQINLFSQCEECNHFEVTLNNIYYTESNCNDNLMTICNDISVFYPDSYGSWQYGILVDGLPNYESEIFNTHLRNTATACITESCTAQIQYYLKTWTGPDGFGVECATYKTLPRALPVVFGDFKAVNKTIGIELQWSTLSELNNEKFQIQRKTDKQEFETIGEIRGLGNSNQQKNYSFLDRTAKQGLNYYRIKQVDKDGHFEFSKVISISNQQEGKELLFYPNPVREEIFFYELADQIIVLDNFGKTIYSYSSGPYRSINLQGLDAGIYWINLKSKNRIEETKRFIKI